MKIEFVGKVAQSIKPSNTGLFGILDFPEDVTRRVCFHENLSYDSKVDPRAQLALFHRWWASVPQDGCTK